MNLYIQMKKIIYLNNTQRNIIFNSNYKKKNV